MRTPVALLTLFLMLPHTGFAASDGAHELAYDHLAELIQKKGIRNLPALFSELKKDDAGKPLTVPAAGKFLTFRYRKAQVTVIPEDSKQLAQVAVEEADPETGDFLVRAVIFARAGKEEPHFFRIPLLRNDEKVTQQTKDAQLEEASLRLDRVVAGIQRHLDSRQPASAADLAGLSEELQKLKQNLRFLSCYRKNAD